MIPLKDRVEEIFRDFNLEVGSLAKVAGVSSSAVSQWIGKGNGRPVQSIGSQEAAERIEKHTGLCALWVAKGKGPKYAVTGTLNVTEAGDTMQASGSAGPALEKAVESLAMNFTNADPSTRETCAALLSSLARNPENHQRISTALQALLFNKTEPALQDPQLTPEEKDRARRLTEAAHAGEQFNLSQHGAKKSVT
jgi:hypothetical protein